MPSIKRLTELSALVSAATQPDEAVRQTLLLLREELEANDVYLIYGGEDGFRCFGSRPDLGLSDIALWLVHRDLMSRRKPAAFDLRDDRVAAFRSATSRKSCDYVAALVPVANQTADMLLARGPWPRGFATARVNLLRAALPAVALIMERRLDSSRAQRQRTQLSALANITHVMSESEDLDTVLTSIAGGIAAVTGIDYVCIDLVGNDGTVDLRCVNSTRPGTDQLKERWIHGANRPDSVRDTVLRTHEPMLFTDAQNDERVPEAGRSFFIQTLIQSTGTLPLITKEEVLGVLSVASHRALEFSVSEVELLEGLSAQVATAVKGIGLYQELAESRRKLQRLNEQLQESMGVEHHLARTDTLTGVPNRRFIDETIEAECARARRYGRPLSVIMADLDNLKQINDTFGHNAGDEALKYLAALARQSCRQVDVAGRYGGDEFVFVLPATGQEEAAALAERFRAALQEGRLPVEHGEPLELTVSLGVAEWDSTKMEGPACLVRHADRAMYAAKGSGRNCTMVAEGESARAA